MELWVAGTRPGLRIGGRRGPPPTPTPRPRLREADARGRPRIARAREEGAVYIGRPQTVGKGILAGESGTVAALFKGAASAPVASTPPSAAFPKNSKIWRVRGGEWGAACTPLRGFWTLVGAQGTVGSLLNRKVG